LMQARTFGALRDQVELLALIGSKSAGGWPPFASSQRGASDLESSSFQALHKLLTAAKEYLGGYA